MWACGYVAWSSVGQGRPAAGLWVPRRGGWERGEGVACGWERSWSGNGSKQSHLPPGPLEFLMVSAARRGGHGPPPAAAACSFEAGPSPGLCFPALGLHSLAAGGALLRRAWFGGPALPLSSPGPLQGA